MTTPTVGLIFPRDTGKRSDTEYVFIERHGATGLLSTAHVHIDLEAAVAERDALLAAGHKEVV